MYTHPYIAAKLVHDRHRDMSADVGQHRTARQFRDLASAAQHTRVIPVRLRRAWHPILRLRAHA